MRWKIEAFHKILKSGCKAEASKLRTADRLANVMAIFCILSWRILWLTLLNRITPEASRKMALTDTEITLLDELVSDAGNRDDAPERSPSTSPNLLDWAVTWRGPATRRQATSSSGAASRG